MRSEKHGQLNDQRCLQTMCLKGMKEIIAVNFKCLLGVGGCGVLFGFGGVFLCGGFFFFSFIYKSYFQGICFNTASILTTLFCSNFCQQVWAGLSGSVSKYECHMPDFPFPRRNKSTEHTARVDLEEVNFTAE